MTDEHNPEIGPETNPEPELDPTAPALADEKPALSNDNELRGDEFRKLMKKPLVLGLLALGAIVAGIVGAFFAPFIGGIAFAGAILIGVVIVFAIADNKAETAFFDSYAESKGLTFGVGSLPETTNLLKEGDHRKTNRYMFGKLSRENVEEADVVLALYTYTNVSYDEDGNREETDYPFTVFYIEMPETVQHISELRVQRKFGFKALQGFEDAFRRNSERVELESEAMIDKYEIFVHKGQDPIWVRRLFSPSFIVWMTENPPNKFFFELQNGSLCCAVPKHRKNTEDLDEMLETGLGVVARLREEVKETSAKN